MWYVWCTLLLVSRALGAAEVPEAAVVTAAAETAAATEVAATTTEAPAQVATTRAPARTLDRQAAELAWRSWLQSPESGNQNAPPRRITTKSLFITPLVCPKGQRLDRNGCIQVVTVDKDEHERILLEQLNAIFTSSPSGDTYDYGDEDPGPLQLTIPIGLDPLAAPLQAHEPAAEAHQQQPTYVKIDKKEGDKTNDASIEAELEILKLQHSINPNDTSGPGILNHNVFNNFLPFPDKPKRDSPQVNESQSSSPTNATDQGQKEQFYGHVNVDTVVYDTQYQNPPQDDLPKGTEVTTEQTNESPPIKVNAAIVNNTAIEKNISILASPVLNKTNNEASTTESADINPHIKDHLTKDRDQTKLNPESEYSDIGEAIKLISRYAEVTTDDSFNKDQKKYALKDDSILGTRTKLQHRRNKPQEPVKPPAPIHALSEEHKEIPLPTSFIPKNEGYYRYPWSSQHPVTPPPDYPFRHLQDYWPNRNPVGGVYGNAGHENPRRHHHTYPHNYYRPHTFPDADRGDLYLRLQGTYAAQPQGYPYRSAPHHVNSMRSHNQDLYTLLGLRHWFSSESTSKR